MASARKDHFKSSYASFSAQQRELQRDRARRDAREAAEEAAESAPDATDATDATDAPSDAGVDAEQPLESASPKA